MEPPDNLGEKSHLNQPSGSFANQMSKKHPNGESLEPLSAVELYLSQQPPWAARALRSHLPLTDGQEEILGENNPLVGNRPLYPDLPGE